jgi:hypothetical protein
MSGSHASVKAEQRGAGQVYLQDPALLVQAEVAYRGKVEKIAVLVRRFLRLHLCAQQFIILHFQFDLMDLQFVEQRPNFELSHTLDLRNIFGSEALFGLAAKFAGL